MGNDERMKCPVCLQTTARTKIENWNDYTLFRCERCDVVFPQPFIAGDANWYMESGNYELARYQKKTYWHHDQFLSEPPAGRKLLDIGCNNGVFLHYAEKLGYEVTGMDFNESSLEAGKQAFGLERLYCCTLQDFVQRFSNQKFDVITAFEVLEHLDNPNEFIENIKKLLKPSGYVAISVPNRDAMINPLGDADYPPHHLTKWSEKSIRNFLIAHGCTIITHKTKKITPEDFAAWFDCHVVKKIDYRIRKRLKKAAARTFEKKWRRGDIQTVPLAYKIRRMELRFLSGLFFPLAVFLRLIRVKGFGQYILSRIDSLEKSR